MKKSSGDNCSARNGLDPKTAQNDMCGKKLIRFRPKDTPGVICIERHSHDESVEISGSLTIENGAAEIDAWIEEELGKAVNKIKESGGVVELIKATLTVTSTSTMTISGEDPMAKESTQKYARILLSAVLSKVEPKEAEDAIRKTLAEVRTKIREEKGK